MKKYDVNLAGPAIQDLDDIYAYIAFILLEEDTAWSQIGRIEKHIFGLDCLPERHQLCPYEPWHSLGVRQVPVDNYIVYYVIEQDKALVTVTRIMYAGSNVGEAKLLEKLQTK